MKIKICSVILITVLLLAASVLPGFAATSGNSNLEKAIDLKILGLFYGTDKGFELERVPTRVEGAVMLLRLLGKETEAKSRNLPHPFTDVPSWANSLIGYMYSTGLTTGTSAGTFGSEEELTARQYVAFVLRALGYSEKNKDFKFENALDKAVETGLLSTSQGGSLKSASSILRNDLAGISYNALKTKLRSSANTLLDKLASQDKVISKVSASVLGLYTSDLQGKYGNVASYTPVKTALGYAAKNSTDLCSILKKSIYSSESAIKIDISNYSGNAAADFEEQLDKAMEAVTTVTGVEDYLRSWKYTLGGNVLSLTMDYRYSKTEYQQQRKQAADSLYKARHVVSNFIKQGMTDYDKELYIHDYIVNHTKYDYENFLKGSIPATSFTAYGSLILGKAVCEGYSEAFKLLSDLSGLECIVVKGKSRGTDGSWTNHAWNIVNVDGSFYHVDSTFDDPITSNGKNVLTYDFFNLTDKALASSHSWSKSQYPACSTSWVLADNLLF